MGYGGGLEPFDIGYAYGALARAMSLAGNPRKAAEYLSPAQRQAQLVKNAERCAALLNDRGGPQAWCSAHRPAEVLASIARRRVYDLALAQPTPSYLCTSR
jgi:hypothetical protein